MMLRYLFEWSTAIARRKQILCILCLAPLIASCTSYEVEDHSLQFNEAVGSLGNRLLLLNAVRAAKGYPMQFSKLGSYTGQGRESGSLAADLPFVLNTVGTGTLAAARLVGTAKPSVSLGTGVQSLQLVDLNTAEAQKALRTQATGKLLEYYLLQGWPQSLVYTIMIEAVAVRKQLHTALAKVYDNHCNTNPDDSRCWLHAKVKQCAWVAGGSTRNNITIVSFWNRPRTYCSFVMFQWFFEAVGVSGGAFDVPGRKKKDKDDKDDSKKQNAIYRSDKFAIDVNVKVPEKEPTETASTDYLDLFFENEAIQRLYESFSKGADQRGKGIEVVFRSPERMVRYLGDIIAAQELANDRHEFEIRYGDQPVKVIEVNRGSDIRASAAVAIVDPERERFFVPIPDHGAPTQNMSLQTLALVMDFLNSAVSGKSIPPPSTLILSGG
ncbi:MAG TPA: hypothetical protein VJ180_06085 [Pyrinomonadaceae bacterium]|nr:hypothetical protein [Pyrinomonadaceae bacterium]